MLFVLIFCNGRKYSEIKNKKIQDLNTQNKIKSPTLKMRLCTHIHIGNYIYFTKENKNGKIIYYLKSYAIYGNEFELNINNQIQFEIKYLPFFLCVRCA